MRVLIVDQERAIRDVMATALEELDISVLSVGHITEEVVREYKPNYIFLAHWVGNTSDVKEEIELVERQGQAKIIIMTTAKTGEARLAFPDMSVLQKPFTLEELHGLLNR